MKYPCSGQVFPTYQAAYEARQQLDPYWLTETPYVYVCTSGHYHLSATRRPDLRAALARVLHIDVADLPEPAAYDDAQEARMSHVAETFDPETGRSQGLLPTTEETP